MKYRLFNKDKHDISLLGLGGMRFPTNKDGTINIEEAEKIVDYAYSNGINYFDTGFMYHEGQSEGFLGKALSKYPRDSYNLVSKMPIWMIEEAGGVEAIFNEQLSRCGVDYFDFYLCHAVDSANFDSYVKEGVFEFLTEMKNQGKIGHIGFSFHDSAETLEKVINAYPWEFVQIQLNYLDWTMQDAKGQYEVIKNHGLQCIIMEPVRGGSLASLSDEADSILKQCRPDKSIASWAIRYAALLPNVLTVLSGMSTIEQVSDNIKTVSELKDFSESEKNALEKALNIYKNKNIVHCTNCKYCMDCPFGVDIPGSFAIYNDYVGRKNKERFASLYKNLGEEHSALHCIECGRCAKLCPQKLDIPERLKEVKTLLNEIEK